MEFTFIFNQFNFVIKLKYHRYAKNRVTKQMLRQVFNIKKIPCYSQFTNIMSIIDNTQLEEAFRAWTQ